MITLIVAVNNKNTIGLKGTMPWHNREDLQHFKNVTMGKKVVMGSRTIVGLPKPLEGRHVLMVSSRAKGEDVIHDFEAFLKEHETSEEDIIIAGGGQIYKQAQPYAKTILLSKIDDDTEGDTFFDPSLLEGFKLKIEVPFSTFNLLHYERENV